MGPHSPLRTTLVLSALALLLAAGVSSYVDPDMWHGMALARAIIAARAIPWQDGFAYTPTVTPVVHHEWAEGLVVHAIVTRGGLVGLAVLKWLLTAGIAAAAVHQAMRRGTSIGVIAALAPIAILMSWVGMTTVRAQMFTLLFLVGLLACLESDRAGSRRWIVPWLLVYLLWLNFHAGFVVGAVLFGVHTIEQAVRRHPVRHLLLVGLAMLGLVALNPWGVAYYTYLYNALTLDRSLVTEWLPLWRVAPVTLPAFAVSLLLLAYALREHGPGDAPGWPLVLVSAAAALRHQRHLAIHAVVWLCLVPPLLEETPLGARLRAFHGRRLATGLWGLLLLAGAIAVAGQRPWVLRVPANPGEHPTILYPAGAVAYLGEVGFRGNVMVPFVTGAYVTWKLYPAVRVSFDGRFEAAFPPEALRENMDFFAAAPGWPETLARYPTDVVLAPRQRPITRALQDATDWQLVYQDDAYVLFARPGFPLSGRDRRGERIVASFP